MAIHRAVAGGVFDCVFLCCPFSHEMSWMRTGTKLSQFLRVFLPTHSLKLTLGRMAGVAHFISGHEQAQESQVCYFHFFDVVFASKGLTYQNLFICIAAGVVSCGGRKTSPCTSS